MSERQWGYRTTRTFMVGLFAVLLAVLPVAVIGLVWSIIDTFGWLWPVGVLAFVAATYAVGRSLGDLA